MEKNLAQVIYGKYAEFSKTEKRIADYILGNQQGIPYETLAQCAHGCQTSEPSIMRFVKKIGYTSFVEFKREVLKFDFQKKQKRLAEDEINAFVNMEEAFVKKDASFPEMANTMVDQMSTMVQNVTQMLDLDKIWDIVQHMIHAKRIDLYGVGYSGNVVNEFMFRLVKLGLDCRVYREDSWAQIGKPVITKEDIAIGFSYSGETITTIDAIRYATEVGAKTVAVTGNPESQLVKKSDFAIFTPKVNSDLMNFSMATCIGQMVITDILYLGILSADWDNFMSAWVKFTSPIGE